MLSIRSYDDVLLWCGLFYANHTKDAITAAVIVADLRHNSDLSRLDPVGDKDMERLRKYQQALALQEEDAK